MYRKVKSQDEVYLVRNSRDFIGELFDVCDAVAPHQVTAKDAELLTAVRDVIREDSQREKCACTCVCACVCVSAAQLRQRLF